MHTLTFVIELARKQFEKEKEEFNGILYASVRTKMPSSDKVMPHDQMHWLKTLIFTPLQCIDGKLKDIQVNRNTEIMSET